MSFLRRKREKMKNFKFAMLAMVCVLMTACTSTPEPTKGDIIKAQGAEFTKIGEQWNKGDAMIAEGNDLIKVGKKEITKGEDLVDSGESKVEKGQKMIKKGNNMKAEADKALAAKN